MKFQGLKARRIRREQPIPSPRAPGLQPSKTVGSGFTWACDPGWYAPGLRPSGRGSLQPQRTGKLGLRVAASLTNRPWTWTDEPGQTVLSFLARPTRPPKNLTSSSQRKTPAPHRIPNQYQSKSANGATHSRSTPKHERQCRTASQIRNMPQTPTARRIPAWVEGPGLRPKEILRGLKARRIRREREQ